eukprot:scaffold1462_cov260-Pinguiococcus_pyrenoidosus.AAC.7
MRARGANAKALPTSSALSRVLRAIRRGSAGGQTGLVKAVAQSCGGVARFCGFDFGGANLAIAKSRSLQLKLTRLGGRVERPVQYQSPGGEVEVDLPQFRRLYPADECARRITSFRPPRSAPKLSGLGDSSGDRTVIATVFLRLLTVQSRLLVSVHLAS